MIFDVESMKKAMLEFEVNHMEYIIILKLNYQCINIGPINNFSCMFEGLILFEIECCFEKQFFSAPFTVN